MPRATDPNFSNDASIDLQGVSWCQGLSVNFFPLEGNKLGNIREAKNF